MSTPLNAVLARLNISQFSNSREDTGITAEVKTLHKLAGKAGKWTKYKLPEEYLAGVRKAAGNARTTHYDLTLPWVDGSRLLSVAARTRYEADMAKAREAFTAQVDEFFARYDDAIADARKMHNGTFNESDYPPADTCRQQFGIAVEYSPVPQANHFGGLFTGQDMERMRAQLESTNSQRINAAVADTMARLMQPVQHMAEVLADKQAVFRNSLVENVREVLALVPVLNVTGDQRIATAANQITAALGSLNPDDLRDSVVIRRAAASAAGDIVRKFGAVGARKF